MENNYANKKGWLTQYYNQKGYYSVEYGEKIPLYNISNSVKDSDNQNYLVLKSVKNITEEDTINISKILGLIINTIDLCKLLDDTLESIINKPKGKSFIELLEQNGFSPSSNKTFEIYQYLISKGYLLPYFDLSTQQIINYGWVQVQ
jgi:hypothetical protein